MNDEEWVKKVSQMNLRELTHEILVRWDDLGDFYYRDLNEALKKRLEDLVEETL